MEHQRIGGQLGRPGFGSEPSQEFRASRQTPHLLSCRVVDDGEGPRGTAEEHREFIQSKTLGARVVLHHHPQRRLTTENDRLVTWRNGRDDQANAQTSGGRGQLLRGELHDAGRPIEDRAPQSARREAARRGLELHVQQGRRRKPLDDLGRLKAELRRNRFFTPGRNIEVPAGQQQAKPEGAEQGAAAHQPVPRAAGRR